MEQPLVWRICSEGRVAWNDSPSPGTPPFVVRAYTIERPAS